MKKTKKVSIKKKKQLEELEQGNFATWNIVNPNSTLSIKLREENKRLLSHLRIANQLLSQSIRIIEKIKRKKGPITPAQDKKIQDFKFSCKKYFFQLVTDVIKEY